MANLRGKRAAEARRTFGAFHAGVLGHGPGRRHGWWQGPAAEGCGQWAGPCGAETLCMLGAAFSSVASPNCTTRKALIDSVYKRVHHGGPEVILVESCRQNPTPSRRSLFEGRVKRPGARTGGPNSLAAASRFRLVGRWPPSPPPPPKPPDSSAVEPFSCGHKNLHQCMVNLNNLIQVRRCAALVCCESQRSRVSLQAVWCAASF